MAARLHRARLVPDEELVRQCASTANVPTQRFFAGVRFLGVIRSETPIIVALWRVAPSVRLRDFAIFESGSLRAMLLRRRRSSFDHGLLTGGFLPRARALTTSAPDR